MYLTFTCKRPNSNAPWAAEVVGCFAEGLRLCWVNKTRIDATSWRMEFHHDGIYWVLNGGRRYYMMLIGQDAIPWEPFRDIKELMQEEGIAYASAWQYQYDDLLGQYTYLRARSQQHYNPLVLDLSDLDNL